MVEILTLAPKRPQDGGESGPNVLHGCNLARDAAGAGGRVGVSPRPADGDTGEGRGGRNAPHGRGSMRSLGRRGGALSTHG